MIAVIDYGTCNTGSVVNMFKKIGAPAVSTKSAKDLVNCTRIVLPGVGSFDVAVKKLHELNLVAALQEEVTVKKKPILGVCLGMQLLANESEEGTLKGFGWIPGQVKKFVFSEHSKKKLPHMGWNTAHLTGRHKSFPTLPSDSKFYFVHSYHYDCEEKYILGTTTYGKSFPSIVGQDHIIGAQFHPEKSHKYGLNFLSQFLEVT